MRIIFFIIGIWLLFFAAMYFEDAKKIAKGEIHFANRHMADYHKSHCLWIGGLCAILGFTILSVILFFYPATL